MEDPVWGRPPEAKGIRQAIAWAVDLDQRNAAFYNSFNTLYEGPIPPGLDGYEPGHRKRNVARARELLARAGHPGGAGLPALVYETSQGGNSAEQAEMLARQLAEVGLEIDVNLNSFPELSDKLNRKKAPFFGLAWGADYPDAENFLQLFYGPNEAPGSNNFNYKNADFDELFARARIMPPSPERTAIYRRLRAMVIEDQPMIGSMARTRFYLWHPRLQNYRPEEVYSTFWKYLDLADHDGEPPAPAVARH
jgi:ABC-type transport system substrate-binding protein